MDFIIAFLVDYRHDRRAKPCFFSFPGTCLGTRACSTTPVGHAYSRLLRGSHPEHTTTFLCLLLSSCKAGYPSIEGVCSNDDAYTAGFVVRADDGRVPLRRAVYAVHLQPETNQDGGHVEQEVLALLFLQSDAHCLRGRLFFFIIEISVFHQCALACVAPNLAFEKRFSGIDYIQMVFH
ncbi:hypothetical protein CAPTEDRAFT_225578 [Capitella teleta]|uniref:Uncharacterized protein n=1 Tax=Capitella teleta TaxID=283909 RepID=R7V2X3_CAPTE|nr:hypothetical protein CAPTEDRAFT_225578 [Capitella teleta]|eukprot:ELU13178.1 hypothetical protein CAPTEDRAFT_225578 [Capitella teleta]